MLPKAFASIAFVPNWAPMPGDRLYATKLRAMFASPPRRLFTTFRLCCSTPARGLMPGSATTNMGWSVWSSEPRLRRTGKPWCNWRRGGWSGDIERLARAAVRSAVKGAQSSFLKPYEEWLSEDYCIVHVNQQPGLTASDLISVRGKEIAQIVRGEAATFAPAEQADILQARISYYPADLLVVGWSAAFLYDSAEGASSTIELLDYANTQLLDFRHYDELLSGILAGVYRKLETRRGPLMRWRLFRDANKLHTVLLDIRQLTEHMDNSIKFLSDMFDARLYRLAAARVGVPDYRRLVDEKLRTAS